MPPVRVGHVRIGWLLTGAPTMVTAGWASSNSGVYADVIPSATRPGALSQDVISLTVGQVLCGLALPRTRAGAIGLVRTSTGMGRQSAANSGGPQ